MNSVGVTLPAKRLSEPLIVLSGDLRDVRQAQLALRYSKLCTRHAKRQES